jgi:hypothetical protein
MLSGRAKEVVGDEEDGDGAADLEDPSQLVLVR